jgi:SNF2 family DNA or RNA helicase
MCPLCLDGVIDSPEVIEEDVVILGNELDNKNQQPKSNPNDLVKVTCCQIKVIFHKSCLVNYSAKNFNKCPVCTQRLTYEDEGDARVVFSGVGVNTSTKTKTKIDQLTEIINEKERMNVVNGKPNWKMLIFSDYMGSFDSIKILLEQRGIKYGEMGGNLLDINDFLEDFSKVNSNLRVLLVHSQYGAGSNLEIATDVVLVHKTPRQVQLEGRAQRLGRKGPLTIHHLLYSGE